MLYPLQESELDMLATGYTSVHFGLAGITIGSLITLIVTRVVTSTPTDSVRNFLNLAILLFAVLTVYFVAMAGVDFWRSKKLLKKIKTHTSMVTVSQNE